MKILRWIAVLPGAVAGFVVIQLLMSTLLSVSDLPEFYKHIVNNVVGGYVFVFAGYYITPTHKSITAVCMAVLYAIAMAVLVTLFLQSGSLSWWTLASASAGIVTATITAIGLPSCTKKKPQLPEPSQVTGWN